MLILKIFYNIFIFLSIPVILPLGYIFALKKGEENSYFERFGFISLKGSHKNSVWFHCASVGEVKSIEPFISEVRKKFPDYSIVCSTITATGKKTAENYLKPDETFLLPIENIFAIRYLIKILNTRIIFIVDTEFWPNFIQTASKYTKLCLINGRISDKSYKPYKRFSFIFKYLLGHFDKIFVKSQNDLEKFYNIIGKRDNIVSIGNIKFMSPKAIEIPDKFKSLKDKIIFTAGSTHESEEALALESFTKNRNLFHLLVIAPRHINRADQVLREARNQGLTAIRFSEFQPDSIPDAVIVDSIGELEMFYFISGKIFIGGSFVKKGGHNIFEALQFKKIISTGKYLQNFTEIAEIALKYKLIKIVENSEDLSNYLQENSDDEHLFEDFFNTLYSINKNKLNVLASEIPHEDNN